jgi:hypothetical protein
MEAPERVLVDAERILEKSLSDYRAAVNGSLAHEFYELRLQAAIFQYDICYEFSAQWRAEPKGFAHKVALRNLVHKIYEYDIALANRITKRILDLAKGRGLEIDQERIRSEKKRWRQELALLRRWSNLRNEASAHYGKDIESQVSLVESLDHDDVVSVTMAFLSFNNFICKVLAGVGQGRAC